MMDQKQFCYHS